MMIARQIVENESYAVVDESGCERMSMRRESDFGGNWVLRNTDGYMLGWDQYRHDLFARFNIVG